MKAAPPAWCRTGCVAVCATLAAVSSATAQSVRDIPAGYVRPLPVFGTVADATVMRLSRDGSRAQVRLADAVLLVVDTRTGATLFDSRTLAPPERQLYDTLMTPDGRTIVYGERATTAESGRTIRARDIETGQDRVVAITPTNVQLEDATDDVATVAYLTQDSSLPRVGVIGPRLPAREFADPCPDGSSSAFVSGPVQLTVGGLLALYTRISQPPGTPPSSQIFRTAVGVTTSATGWCRAPYDPTVHADLFVNRGSAGLWAIPARGLPRTGAGTGSLVNLYTMEEVPVVPAFYRTRPHGGSRSDRFLPFTGAPSPGLSDGLYVLDRMTGVIAAIVPASAALPYWILTAPPLMSDDGTTVVYSAIQLNASGVGAGPRTTFVARLDGDADGQFDAWELTFGLAPTSPADALTDTDGDGRTNAEEFAAGSHPTGTPIRHFAEGAHGNFFATSLALFNPTGGPTTANVRFLGPFGQTVSRALTLPAFGTTHLDVDDVGLPFTEFGMVVEAAVQLVADRRMTWDRASHYGSHSGTGVEAPATTWHFAEGATTAGFQTFFLVQNPSATTATVTLRYLLADGAIEQRSRWVGPNARATVWANQEGGRMAAAEFGTTITSDVPIVTERAMYRDAPGELFAAGSVTAGVVVPGTSWFFAEGATGAFFDTFILLSNPGDTPATVDVEFIRAHDLRDITTALPVQRQYVLAPGTRRTIWVAQEDPALRNTQVGVRLLATAPIVAERSMWWPGPTAATWREVHAETGATAGAQMWGVADIQAEATTGGWDTFLLVATTQQSLARIRVAVSCEDGTTVVRDRNISVNRTTLWMRHDFPEVIGRRCAATIESLPARITSSPSVPLTRVPLVVEKAMYLGSDFRAGGATLATRLPDPP